MLGCMHYYAEIKIICSQITLQRIFVLFDILDAFFK